MVARAVRVVLVAVQEALALVPAQVQLPVRARPALVMPVQATKARYSAPRRARRRLATRLRPLLRLRRRQTR
jgi:hypothetical protein